MQCLYFSPFMERIMISIYSVSGVLFKKIIHTLVLKGLDLYNTTG